ncbi:MAG: hypothetical protein JWN50_215 [Parcubacteria group bacterium]|nr:hypothetical protein [Parcubacteria group bacterium]
MKVPYSIQGALFAPACAVLIFVLKITCPAPNGVGCFADPFITPLFFPLPFFYRVFGNMHALVYHEPWFVLGYWTLVGLVAGACVDIWKKETNS